MGEPQGSIEPPPPSAAGRGRWLWPLAQAAITLAVLIWVFADAALLAQMRATLQQARPLWILAGFLLGGVWLVIAVERWRIFLRVQGVPLSYGRAGAIYLISLFFSLFLPGAGAGAVRAFYVWREHPGRHNAAISSVILDHLAGFVGIVTLALLFTFTRAEWFEHSALTRTLLHFLGGFLVFSLGSLLFALVGIKTGQLQFVARFLPGGPKLVEFTETLVLFFTAWRASLLGVLLSFPVLLGYFATFYCAGRAVAAGVSLPDMLSVMPIIDVVSGMPLTISGLGVREKLFEELLARLAGVPSATALLLSLIGFGFSAAWSLVGGLVFPLYRRGTPTST